MTSFASQETRESRKGKAREGNVPAGSIVFSPLDPFTKEDLVDPVLANGEFSLLARLRTFVD